MCCGGDGFNDPSSIERTTTVRRDDLDQSWGVGPLFEGGAEAGGIVDLVGVYAEGTSNGDETLSVRGRDQVCEGLRIDSIGVCLGEESEDATAVVVDDHYRQRDPKAPRGGQ